MDSNKLLISIARILNETNLFNKSFSIQQSIALGGSLAHGIAWLGVRPPSKQQIGNPIARRPPLSNKGVKSFLNQRLLISFLCQIFHIYKQFMDCSLNVSYTHSKYSGHQNQLYVNCVSYSLYYEYCSIKHILYTFIA